MMNKKAQEGSGMPIATLVVILLLILSFIILIYFFAQVGFGSRADKETCHQSVIIRATTPAFAGLKSAVPLKCQTEKVCITSKLFGGKCAEFEGTKGITTVRVGTKTDVERVLTQNLFDCWTMMGEGKVSLFSQWFADTYGFGGIYSTCTVCGRVAFDSESLAKAGINASEINVEEYMRTHIISGMNKTYAEYLGGEGGKITIQPLSVAETTEAAPKTEEEQTAFDELSAEEKAQLVIKEEDLEAGTLTPLNYSVDTLGIIFTQVTAPTHGGTFKNLVGTVLGGLGFSAITAPGTFLKTAKSWVSVGVKIPSAGGIPSPVPTYVPGSSWDAPKTIWQRIGGTKVSGGVTKAGIRAGKIVGAIAVVTTIVQQVNVAYDRSVSAGYCGDVSVGSEARDGCSVVRLVNYNATDLGSYCSVIESIP